MRPGRPLKRGVRHFVWVYDFVAMQKENLRVKRLTIGIANLLILSNLLVLPQTTLTAQTARTKIPDEYAPKLHLFEQFVKNQMEKDKTPGLTIGFTKNNYTWVQGFGYADIENRIPAKADSAYRLASVTKTMTGTAIVQLAQEGKINLDAEIQTYLPYYPKQKWPVTVRQLLVHLGGGQTGSGIGPEYVTPREVVARIARYPIQNEPGVKFEYTTSGYNLLGAAIEEVSGKPFADYLRANIFAPLGMKDTRLDNAKDSIPNRVQRYELVKGEIKKAPFIDVSSRFGGGGAIGTVPDMLRWASNLERSGILSRSSIKLMFTPVANKGGRFVGLDDGAWYYTLGWLVFPVNGQYVFYNDGGQIGTNTMVLHIPSENLTIAFACNLMTIDRMPYVKRLYEVVTGRPWDVPVYTKSKIDEMLYRGFSYTFNYGALHFDQTKKPYSINQQELVRAFAYFNRVVNRDSLQTAFEQTQTAINDGRHPVADSAFIKVGSYMAMSLRKEYGAERIDLYHSTGAIPFFADYIKMYKANSRHPAELRFSAPFEQVVERWNQDWTKTWNNYTRHFSFNAGSDLINIDRNLKEIFHGAEIYPNLIQQLLELRQFFESRNEWEKAAGAAKIAAERYPQSDLTNGYYAISLIILGKKEETLESLKKAAAINSRGIASAKALNQIALNLAGVAKLEAGIEWLKVAIEIYPREAGLYGTLGDFYQKQGQKEQAIETYKKALDVDPNFEHAKAMLKKLMG
jgi:CubicO group peptidase (beta-lactamase class C family)/tetratricopeptide (TPR) repeat protein